jgi:hypothetical protein
VAIKADIKFLSGEVIRCVGRVVDGKGVPWKDENDLRDHIDTINKKHVGLVIVAIIRD